MKAVLLLTAITLVSTGGITIASDVVAGGAMVASGLGILLVRERLKEVRL